MKTELPIILLFFLLNFCTTFRAEAEVSVAVRGAVGCGQWIEERKSGGWPKTINESLVTGYLSGLAMGIKKDTLDEVPNQSIFLWIDNYCLKNPLNDIYDASNRLTNELERKKKL